MFASQARLHRFWHIRKGARSECCGRRIVKDLASRRFSSVNLPRVEEPNENTEGSAADERRWQSAHPRLRTHGRTHLTLSRVAISLIGSMRSQCCRAGLKIEALPFKPVAICRRRINPLRAPLVQNSSHPDQQGARAALTAIPGVSASAR